MSRYGLLDPGTSLPVLESICHVYDIRDSLEFGAGIWSTFSLIRNCESVTSIESDLKWVKKVRKDYSHKNNLDVIYWTKPMNEYLKETGKNFDLIFIDGDDRLQCLNDSVDRSPIIVCHDTHRKSMGWESAIIPDHYEGLTYIGCYPYFTTIFYHQDTNLKNILFDIDNFSHRGTYIDEECWREVDKMKLKSSLMFKSGGKGIHGQVKKILSFLQIINSETLLGV